MKKKKLSKIEFKISIFRIYFSSLNKLKLNKISNTKTQTKINAKNILLNR